MGLIDLNKLALRIKNELSSFEPKEKELPTEFKKVFTKVNTNDLIVYNRYSFTINASSNLKIYIPNQWLYIAARLTDYYKEITKYREVILSQRPSNVDSKSYGELIKNCYQNVNNANELLKHYSGEDKTLLIKFLTDYSWWNGGKSIERNDFYVSPILTIAGLVNASQGYVAELCKNLADNSEAFELLKNESERIPTEIKLTETSLAQFVYKLFQILYRIDKFKSFIKDAIKDQRDKGKIGYKFSSSNYKYHLVGLFLEANDQLIQEANFTTKRWFENSFLLNEKEIYLSTQWFSPEFKQNGELYQLSFPHLKRFIERYYSQYTVEKIDELYSFSMTKAPLQQIIYGAPGTGKSHLIKAQTKDKSVIRTTFHPDSDYSTFVGAYKPSTAEQVKYGLQGQPILGNDGKPLKEQIITYKFVQQAFVKAYIAAWRNYPKPQYLVIEEINRGNCAQIFGDLFQLLDRNDEGFSEYSIAADEDLRKELKEQLENSDNEIKASYQKVFNGEELLLPNNLYIWATMNTSDQSLFPIDSAFKRRWEWKYVPICNANEGYYISVNGKKYDWWNFLEAINKKIEETTSSEDKKMGYFFCKAKDDGCICADTFVGKVLFYIWNDVFKDYGFDDAIFKDAEGRVLKFQQFFKTDGSANEDMVELFLNNLKLSPVSDTASGDAKTTAAEEEDLSSEQ